MESPLVAAGFYGARAGALSQKTVKAVQKTVKLCARLAARRGWDARLHRAQRAA
jgi:hypothetical protein